MKLGIMQPYFFPYLGYWQLMNYVDRYVIYDNIQFTKNGWIRRNRILSGGTDKMFTLPLKRDSDYLDVCQRTLADDFAKEQTRLLRLIEASYKKAPMFDKVFPIVKDAVEFGSKNLFEYIFYSIQKVCEYLNIKTEIVISSKLNINSSLKGKDRVLAICKYMGATDYYNPANGISLYDPYRSEFEASGVKLHFTKMREITYPQFNNEFIPSLSIIDVMMFNTKEHIQEMLSEFDIM